MFDLPPDLPQDVPFSCVQTAARDYAIPEAVLYGVRLTENGSIGQYSVNSDGSKDYGITQINDDWAQLFAKKYQITVEQLMNDGCLSYRASAYIIRYEINRVGDFWKGVGNYHSRTPSLNRRYLEKLIPNVYRMQDILTRAYGLSKEQN